MRSSSQELHLLDQERQAGLGSSSQIGFWSLRYISMIASAICLYEDLIHGRSLSYQH